jgi:hypothetical protein
MQASEQASGTYVAGRYSYIEQRELGGYTANVDGTDLWVRNPARPDTSAKLDTTQFTAATLPDGLADMVTAAGLASMRGNATWWMALQAASLRPRAAASAGVALACAAGRWPTHSSACRLPSAPCSSCGPSKGK